MLKKISKIKNIRNYHDFSCTCEFTKRNVIYALNGSGKTNLSRFLDSFQTSILNIDDFNKLKSLEAKKDNNPIDFELVFNKANVVNVNNLQMPDNAKIFVYNKDFLEKNINITDFSQKTHSGKIKIGTIGANQSEIERLDKELKQIAKEGTDINTEFSNHLSLLTTQLQTDTKGKLTTFTDILKIENFNQEYINSIPNIAELSKSKENFIEINKIDENDKINQFLASNVSVELEIINQVLLQSFKFEDIEAELESHINSVSKDWVEKGVHLHSEENKNLCPFCRQSTSALNVIKKYVEYIESQKAKTIDKIKKQIENLSLIKGMIEANQKSLDAGLYQNVISKMKLLGMSSSTFFQVVSESQSITNISTLSDLLNQKLGNLEKTISDDDTIKIDTLISSLTNQIETFIQKSNTNNKIINQVNKKISDTGNRKSELRKQIAQYSLYEYFNSMSDKRAIKAELQTKYLQTKDKLSIEKNKSPQKDKKELIVKLLNKSLIISGLNKYSVDDDFKLIYNIKDSTSFDITSNTNLISDGEKSVIAFSYYLASTIQYIDKFEDLEHITLVIDDPISSTSYNYLHGIGIVLKKMNALFQEVLEQNRNEVPQIIILTHNLQFYNLLATNIFKSKPEDKKKKNSLFTLSKKDGNPILIEEKQSRKLSEYMTALIRIYKFNNDELDENIGNDLRKVMETICSFHFMSLSHDNIEKIFGLSIDTNLKLFADDYVHTDFNNFEDPVSTDNLKCACSILLNAINSSYPEQFKQIEKYCTQID